MIKDSAWKKFKEYKKYKDLFDKNTLEFKASIISAILLGGMIYLFFPRISNENLNILLESLTKDIAIGLIGFLGFTVAGLAILTGIVSKKFVDTVVYKEKLINLEKILLSFYFLGIIIGFSIVAHIICYMLSLCTLPCYRSVITIIIAVFSFLDVFIIFYSVKLVGNCLDIFFLVNKSDLQNDLEEDRERIQYTLYLYRLRALETVCLKKLGSEAFEEFKQTIEKQIKEDPKNKTYKSELTKIYERLYKENE